MNNYPRRGPRVPVPREMNSRFAGKCNACSCDFPAGTKIVWVAGGGGRHATPEQCKEAMARRATERAAREASNPTINLAPIMQFLQAAKDRGLKNPKLRVLSTDGKTELRLSITKHGANPGSVAVVEGDNFIGCVRPSGSTTQELAKNEKMQQHLLRVAKDPITAAKEYAALMGLCSFCGLQLTDAGSVEVGYGPVCAKHWGLPHWPKGVPTLGLVPNGD